MQNCAEAEVVKALHRVAKAMRRGDNPALVAPALVWEQKLQNELEELEKAAVREHELDHAKVA